MNETHNSQHIELYSIDDDSLLNESINTAISLSKNRDNKKVKNLLQEIFIIAKITDYIKLKDAIWISDNFNIYIFSKLWQHSDKYLNGHVIEHSYECRKVFGRMTKYKGHHMNYQNFRLLFIDCVLSTTNNALNH